MGHGKGVQEIIEAWGAGRPLRVLRQLPDAQHGTCPARKRLGRASSCNPCRLPLRASVCLPCQPGTAAVLTPALLRRCPLPAAPAPAVNGTPSCVNRELLQGTLRDGMGFQGDVVTNCTGGPGWLLRVLVWTVLWGYAGVGWSSRKCRRSQDRVAPAAHRTHARCVPSSTSPTHALSTRLAPQPWRA